MPQRIYLDHAATGPVDPRVFEAMRPWLSERFGNAAAVHRRGQEARAALEAARAQVAALIGAGDPADLIFTSGGTEANQLALVGLSRPGGAVVTSAVEHASVLEAARALASLGRVHRQLPVTSLALVPKEAVDEAGVGPGDLVSVMLVQNEVGSIEPVRAIADAAHRRGALVHTDAVQAAGSWPVDVAELGVDALSLSAHKFGGPQGVGALWIRPGAPFAPLFAGGAHERGRRPGTVPVALAVGMGEAARLARIELPERAFRLSRLRDRLLREVRSRVRGVELNGPEPPERSPGNLNLSFEGIAAGILLVRLDLEGVEASAGAACASGSTDVSHVLRAMGLPPGRAQSALRFTVGTTTRPREVDEAARRIRRAVAGIREGRGVAREA